METNNPHGGDEAVERATQEAIESEDEKRDKWATAMLRKIADRAINYNI